MHGLLEKVKVEREALGLVNGVFGSPELAGISLAAIETWVAADPQRRQPMVDRLVAVSRLTMSLWERSGGRLDETYDSVQTDTVAALANSRRPSPNKPLQRPRRRASRPLIGRLSYYPQSFLFEPAPASAFSARRTTSFRPRLEPRILIADAWRLKTSLSRC